MCQEGREKEEERERDEGKSEEACENQREEGTDLMNREESTDCMINISRQQNQTTPIPNLS